MSQSRIKKKKICPYQGFEAQDNVFEQKLSTLDEFHLVQKSSFQFLPQNKKNKKKQVLYNLAIFPAGGKCAGKITSTKFSKTFDEWNWGSAT